MIHHRGELATLPIGARSNRILQLHMQDFQDQGFCKTKREQGLLEHRKKGSYLQQIVWNGLMFTGVRVLHHIC